MKEGSNKNVNFSDISIGDDIKTTEYYSKPRIITESEMNNPKVITESIIGPPKIVNE